ncbi:hypothetical protein DFH09DRAFT_913548 [Mycena vulgaris]|nr:hypothetical protein DFH09DRAFT_913548 [Mycena vulgaris]
MLGDRERVWASYQPFLEQRGYMLRPRYRPGWVSEAETTGKDPHLCEDSIPAGSCEILDATRICDGAQVVLKIVETVSAETAISAFLTSEPGAEKHAIQVLELIQLYDRPEWAFMVMLRMRTSNDLPFFTTVHEFTEFVQQVLEARNILPFDAGNLTVCQGLVFLHSKNIAHRDICCFNIVVDPWRLIPGGFHFIISGTSDGVNRLEFYGASESSPRIMRSRFAAGPMKYYYIDFGLSVHFPSPEARARVTGACGRLRKHVPEISDTVPYDPFKVDVRLVGEMLRSEFLHFYAGLDFVIPFVRKLRRDNPQRRPDAAVALALFQRLVSKMSQKALETYITIRVPGKQRRAILFLQGI